MIYHYVGDSADDACDDGCFFNGAVRITADGIVGGDRLEEIHNILLNSGADASIFPAGLLGKRRPAANSTGRWMDA